MPRIRTVKPEHWLDKELSNITMQAHLLWIGLWNFSDDEGIFENDPLLIKSQIFPRRTDVRVEQVSQWLDQLVKARFVIPFVHDNVSYCIHRTFKTHQKIDKPQKSKIPINIIRGVFDERSTNIQPCIVEDGKGKERNSTAIAVVDSPSAESPSDIQQVFKELKKEKKELVEFIRKNKPDFIEPYVELWNVFAEEKKLAKVSKINTTRKKKFNVRIGEKGFDFLLILKQASSSQFLLTGNWFGFDWIIENESNYLKVIEGNYDKKADNKPPSSFAMPPKVLSKNEKQINQRYGEFLDNRLTPTWIDKEDFEFLVKKGVQFSTHQKEVVQAVSVYIQQQGYTNEPGIVEPLAKCFSVIEYFKEAQRSGIKSIFN
jgi:hypothetical protein